MIIYYIKINLYQKSCGVLKNVKGKRLIVIIIIIKQSERFLPKIILTKSIIFFADNIKNTTVAPNCVKLTQKDATVLKKYI